MYKFQGFWDRIANTYARAPIRNPEAHQAMIDNIREHTRKSDYVLDFGCGTGTYSIAIADNVRAIHATDISPKMLAIAEQRAGEQDIENISFEYLGLFDRKLVRESYSVVLAFNILHLQQDLDATLERIYQLLTPGGLLITKSVCAGEKFSLTPYLLKPFSKLGILPHVNHFTVAQLQQSLKKNHLVIIDTRQNLDDGSMEYFIVARKPVQH